MLLLLLACAPDSDVRDGVKRGPNSNDTAGEDSHVDDSAADDTADDDTADNSGQLCFPGEDEDWTTCLPLVSWQASWGEDYDYPEPLEGSPQYRKPVRFVDLSQVNESTKLAPNFALGEFMSATKGRYGLYQPHAVERIQALRDRVGAPVNVNSGYRNVSYNAGVGGATWSRHIYGDALDMWSSATSLDSLAGHCEALGAGYIGWYETHIHCDWRDDALNEALFGPSPPPGPAVHHRTPCGNDDGPPLREWWR